MNIFNFEELLQELSAHTILFTVSVFVGAFLTTYIIIPKVIWVTQVKNLSTPVIGRSAHKIPTPAFGGVAFFITLVLIVSFIQSIHLNYVGNHLIAALTILFMVGLKDDLIISTARVKLIGQLMAIAFILFSPELQITSLNGFFNTYEIPQWLSVFLAVVIMLSIINAYNLIDGIDGLAGIIGIIICAIYAVLFYFTNHSFYFMISVAIVAILGAFLRYNFASGTNKIFMGDSGSLVIGFLIGFLTLKFMVLEPFMIKEYDFKPENRIIFIIAILFIPTFDTTRIIISRLLKRENPFAADRNHAHHILIDLGLSHGKASILLGLLNVFIVMVFLLLGRYYSCFVMTFVMAALFFLFTYMFFALKTRKLKK
jgi:UDP-GlcNAc:undecaprenyl-phosphate GlcNAc-1-phosphate transferase